MGTPCVEVDQTQSPFASFWDPRAQVRFEFHRPAEQPELWGQYLDGAVASYREHDVEEALDLAAIEDGRSTELFLTGLDHDGTVLCGLRVHGPLSSPFDAHVLGEFGGSREVRTLLDNRLPHGVAEIRGCWVKSDASRRSELSDGLARCFVHAMTLLDVQFSCCSAAVHALGRWQGSGGQRIPGLASVPYPDDRYETTMLWWNRATVHRTALPNQWRRICVERAALHDFDGARAITDRPLIGAVALH